MGLCTARLNYYFINIFALAPYVFLMIVLDKVVNYESYALFMLWQVEC